MMNAITKDMAMRLLELLRDTAGTSMDYMTLWADTDQECHVCYNPNMGNGIYEFVGNYAEDYESIDNIDDAADTIVAWDDVYRYRLADTGTNWRANTSHTTRR